MLPLGPIELRRLRRYFIVREMLHNANTSGLYFVSWHSLARVSGFRIETIRADFAQAQRLGICIIGKHKGKQFLKLNQLRGSIGKAFDLFTRHRSEIETDKNPDRYFAGLYQRKVIWSNVYLQALNESRNLSKTDKRKFLKTVNDSKNSVGVRHGIRLSVSTIGRLLNRSKATACKYVLQMHSAGIIERKRNGKYLGPASEINSIRRELEYSKGEGYSYNRLYIVGGLVYERLQNSYRFF